MERPSFSVRKKFFNIRKGQPLGERTAIKSYWQICGFPGGPDYLLTMIHNHKERKVCYWHVMAEERREGS